MTTIAIVGDYQAGNLSHAATSDAVGYCSAALGLDVDHRWVGTEELAQPEGMKRLADFSGFWIAPGSPYKSMSGALLAIRMAREQRIPLLGTCGGFQHIILEYARNVLGFADAEHEETDPQASRRFISRLACSLMGRTMRITLQPDSLAARSYGRTEIQEQYRCSFGVNPEYEDVLRSSALRVTGSDDEGVVRVVELAGHPFFVGTLFVPQLTSARSAPHALHFSICQSCQYERVASDIHDLDRARLIKGALKIMAWSKAKIAIVGGIVVSLAAGTTTVTVKEIQKHSAYQRRGGFDFNLNSHQRSVDYYGMDKNKNGNR